MNIRRKLVIALGASTLLAPLSAYAQKPGKVWRIGVLWENISPTTSKLYLDGFRTGMRELGYTEGRDYVFEVRSAQGEFARLPAAAAELLALKVDLIMPGATPSTEAARKATRDIPILIANVSDPVGSGFAASLKRPGGNVTGLTNISLELVGKRLGLLRQILPGMRRVGFLYDPDNSSDVLGLRQFESDCVKLKFTALPAPLHKAEEIPAVFNILKRDKAQGLIVTGNSTNSALRETIIEQVAKHRLTAVYVSSLFTDSGGLLSYGTNNPDLYRRAAAYADKIFKGAKPGDLPIEQPIKFDMVLNLKTAKALGIKIPDMVMVQVTRVIE